MVAYVTPNPAINTTPLLHIQAASGGIGSVQIIDQQGRIIKVLNNIALKAGNNMILLDLPVNASGYYAVLVRREKNMPL